MKDINPIFVFGSNLAGRHGAGSAKEAVLRWGAICGIASGLHRQSYAIPTKDKNLNVLSLTDIQTHVWTFMAYANAIKHRDFRIVDIGCGLAGYEPEQIAPLFFNAPDNCYFLGRLDQHIKRTKDV